MQKVDEIATWLEETWDSISTTVSNVWNTIKLTIIAVWNDLVLSITKRLEILKTNIENGFNAVKNFVVNIWNSIADFFTRVWNTIYQKASDGVSAVYTYVSNQFNKLKDTLSNIWDAISNKVSDVFNKVAITLRGIKKPVDDVINIFKNLWNNISNFMGKILGNITDAWNKAGNILDKLNPFKAETDINVKHDGDPYNPSEGPMFAKTGLSGVLDGAMSSMMRATSTISSGVNRTMSSFDSLYNKELTPRNNSKTSNKNEDRGSGTVIEGDTYHIHITAQGQLPKSTIREMAKTFQREIKNTNDRRKINKGEVVIP